LSSSAFVDIRIDQTNADRQTKDTPVEEGMVESSKARVVVADGSKMLRA
jgi:hypothetical protein